MRANWFSDERDRSAARRRTALTTVVLAWLASCSLQDFDRLGPGKSGSGTNTAGEAGESSLGGNAAGLGGTSTGSTDQGGSDAAGGLLDVGGSVGIAGNTGDGGTSQSGGTTGVAGGGGMDSTCPSFTGTGGTLITPPSTGFEAAGSWSTLTERACSVTAAAGSGNACEGKSYLSCNGSVRTDSWDGPLFKLDAYFVNGHRYLITAAVRYSPMTAPTSSAGIMGTVIRGCTGGTTADYLTLGNVTTKYEWARITGTVDASLPGCTSLSAFGFYVQTPSGDATLAKLSLDVDDFRIYDITPGAGGSGAAGSGAAGFGAGTSGSAGTANTYAGSAGTSKLPSGGTSGTAGSLGAGKAGNASSLDAGKAGNAGSLGAGRAGNAGSR